MNDGSQWHFTSKYDCSTAQHFSTNNFGCQSVIVVSVVIKVQKVQQFMDVSPMQLGHELMVSQDLTMWQVVPLRLHCATNFQCWLLAIMVIVSRAQILNVQVQTFIVQWSVQLKFLRQARQNELTDSDVNALSYFFFVLVKRICEISWDTSMVPACLSITFSQEHSKNTFRCFFLSNSISAKSTSSICIIDLSIINQSRMPININIIDQIKKTSYIG